MNNKLKELSAYCRRQKACNTCLILSACQSYFKGKPESWDDDILNTASDCKTVEQLQRASAAAFKAGPVNKMPPR